MSLAPYYFRPMTPPEAAAGQQSSHARHASASSFFTNTSPESFASNPTPRRSPVYRQHGPTLLPKIRTQDSGLQRSAGQVKTHQRNVSNLSNLSNVSSVSTFSVSRPPMYRCATEPVECVNPMSPISMGAPSRASSLAPVIPKNHSRSVSNSSINEGHLNRYGYPTYRQMPLYVTQSQQAPTPPVYAQNYSSFSNDIFMEPPSIHLDGSFDLPIDLEHLSRADSMSPPPMLPSTILTSQSMTALSTTSILHYLTQPTQPVNLVRQLTFSTGRGLSSHFWWDVRNLRPWSSFSLDTMSQIPDLMTLLHFQHDTTSLPSLPPNMSTTTPSSEMDLATLISKIYFPKVNAAAKLSLGDNCPSLFVAPTQSTPSTAVASSQPTFLGSYQSENQFTLHGTPRGRVVGLSKSFDRWNTGMRHEGPGQRVQYLKGLAHLQKCMRDHSCRYGFIITEIELVCVRAGCDANGTPYFGYLEVSEGIPTKTCATSSIDMDGNYNEDTPLSVSLALYYLLMLAKQVPLPGQPSSFMDVGGPGALTRQRVWSGSDVVEDERKADGRDKWMPEPQVGERRDAKTARGWVWPSDPWHKREGGRRGRRG